MKKKTLYETLTSFALLYWLSKIFLTKKNTFYSALIDYSIIKQYYRDDPTFHYFVFQQKIHDGKKSNDDYDLVAWAINDHGYVINSDSIPTERLTDEPYLRNKKVNFANVILKRKDLDYLYENPGSSAVLRLFPEPYEETNYVRYRAETINSPVRMVTCNPCPPASQR